MSDTPSSAAICWFEIPVTNLERAQRFYRAVFGCSFRCEPGASPIPGVTLAMFEPTRACPAVNGCLIHGITSGLHRVLMRARNYSPRVVVVTKSSHGQLVDILDDWVLAA